MNPIKSPREMLFEMAGIPSFAKGGKLGMGVEMYRLVTDAIEKYTKKFGRPPPPEDVKALKQHVEEISRKPEIKTDPATQARARHEMATDPNLINPEGPDPFLTKATTGRTVRSTYLKPKVQDIADPNVQANIEAKQAAGVLEDILPESITPSADYMGRMGSAIENATLAAGKTPLIDKLKASFFAKNKRYPTDEELEVIIAEFNPARHQYGTMGPSVVTQRPPTAKGMSEWRARARMEGVPEAYLDKPPADYPKYLRDELELMRGVQPGTTPLPATRINPDRSFAAGGSIMAASPQDMQAEMAVRGRGFKPFAKKLGKRALQGLDIAAVPLGAYGTADSSKELGRRLAKGNYRGAANQALKTAGAAVGTIPFWPFMASGLGLYALGEGLDYLNPTEEEQYTPQRSSVEKMLSSKSNPLARQPSIVDWYLADKWVTDSGLE